MKKITLLAIAFILTGNCFAQRNTRTFDNYMEKSRKRLTGAYIFLGVGAGLTAGGTALIVSAADENDDYYDDNWDGKIIGGAVMMVTGITLMGTSIPFFIMSHRYKKKAINLALKTEKFQQPRLGKQGNQYYPAVSLKINIGR